MSENPFKPDPGRKPKRPRDANQLAKSIVDLATGQAEQAEEPATEPRGSSGGKARANRLTAEQRSKTAKKAAATRWGTDS